MNLLLNLSLILWIHCCFTPIGLAAQQLPIIDLSTGHNTRYIQGLYHGSDKKLSLKQVQDLNHWLPVPHFFSSSHNWVRFRLANRSSSEAKFILYDEWVYLKNIDVFIFEKDKLIVRESDGMEVANPKRPLNSRLSSWKLSLPPGEFEVYIRYEGHVLHMNRLKITTPEEFDQQIQRERSIYGYVFGMLLAAAIYNFGIFVAIRDETFLYYGFYILFFILTNGLMTGYFITLGLMPKSLINLFVVAFCVPGLMYAIYRFTKLFLNVSDASKTAQAGRLISILSLGLAFISFYDLKLAVNLLTIAQFLLVAWLFLIIIVNLKRRTHFVSFIFASGWSLLVIGDLFTMGSWMNVIPHHYLNEWGLMFGGVAEAFILTAGLGWKVHRIHDENMEYQASKNSMAKTIQQVINSNGEHIDNIKVASLYQPAEEVGGDWIFVEKMRNANHVYIIVGDVTDHGFGSAMIASLVRGVVTTTMSISDKLNRSPKDTIIEIAEYLNNSILETGHHLGRLMTANVIALDFDHDQGWFLNAAHPAAYVKESRQAKVRPLFARGSILGWTKEPQFNIKSFSFPKGAQLLCYTDGLLEQESSDGETLSPRFLERNFSENASADKLVETIRGKSEAFWKKSYIQDDITLLVLERTK